LFVTGKDSSAEPSRGNFSLELNVAVVLGMGTLTST